MQLEPGRKYDVSALKLNGWTGGDGTNLDGYNVYDYFTDDGLYLGPDIHGIEPIVETHPEENNETK